MQLNSKNAFVLILSDQALISGMRLLTQVIVARYAAHSEQGIGFYVAVFGFVILAVMLAESFITTPVNVFLPHQSDDQRGAFVGDSFRALMRLIGLIGAVCCLATLAGWLWRWQFMMWVAGVLVWYLPLHLAREYGRRMLLATDRHQTLFFYDLITSFLMLVGLGISISGGSVGAVWAYLLFSIANATFVWLWWRSFKDEVSWGEEFGSNFDKLAFEHGKWVAAEGLFSVVLVYFSQWQITALLGEEAADRYGSCLTLVFIANPFLLGVVSYFGPRASKIFAEAGVAGIRSESYRLAGLVSGVLLVATLVIWAGGDWLMTAVFGSRFAGLGSTVAILSLGMLVLGSGFVFATGLQAIQAPQFNFFASMLSGIAVVSLSFWLLRGDISQAAWAFLISAAIGTLVRVASFHAKLAGFTRGAETSA